MPHTAQAPLRVLFVCANDFGEASAKQALWFARELQARGHTAMISVTGDASSGDREGARDDPPVAVRAHRFAGPRLSTADVCAAEELAPDVIHCWSSRLAAVAVARRLAPATGAPVVVHWEDDEWRIRDDPMGRSAARRAMRPVKRAVARLHPPLGVTMSKGSLRWIAGHAAGLDALTPALAEHVSRRVGLPCEVILPVTPRATAPADGASVSAPAGGSLLKRFAGTPVALWTGAIHPGLEGDVRMCLEAVARVQARGRDVAFAHVGSVLPRYDPRAWAREAGLREGTAAFLGYVPYPRVPALLREASVLLSPGRPNEYNRLRLPSKVQAYLASGTPTIAYAIGFGELLSDRVDALLTRTADPGELADRIDELLSDGDLRATLARGGPAAAARLFDPVANTDALLAYYRRAIAGAGGGARPGEADGATASPAQPAGRT